MQINEHILKVILSTLRSKKNLTVEELIEEVVKSVNVNKHDIAKHLYWLWKKESIVSLKDLSPPLTFSQYVKSLYSLWFWILVSIIIMTASTIYLSSQISPFIYMRYILGSLFVFYLPGFAFIEFLFPRKSDLQQIVRFVLSMGLSLAIVPLVELILNYTPWKIRLDSVFISLSVLTIIFSIIAMKKKFEYFIKETK